MSRWDNTIQTSQTNFPLATCLITILLFVPFALAGDKTLSTTTTHPAGVPETLPFITTKPIEPLPIVPADTVEDALAYSQAEKTILEDVYDRDDQINTSAFYVLLRRAAMLPAGRVVLNQAEQPNPKSLWKEPKRYRGRLIRVEAIYAGRITEYTKNLSPSKWWGNRPVWMMDVVEYQTNKPIIVALTEKPPKITIGTRVKVAGIFYKVVRLPENKQTGDPSKKHDYPIIVAKNVFLFQSLTTGTAPLGAVIMSLTVILMLVAFIMLRHYITRKVKTSQPRRAVEPVPKNPEEDEVDEELLREVESYLAEKQNNEKKKD